jgi:hypothetical protein
MSVNSVILPSVVSYGESLPALPDNTQCINIAAAPVNGATFSAGQQIYLDLVNRGFLVPDSMYLSYSYSLTSAANAELIGCPASTSFNRLDVQVGSMTIDTIQQYNIFYHFLSNVTYDVAQKYGNQASLGYLNSTGVPTLETLDGRLMTLNETGSFALPLVSILSNAEKLIPLFAMPQVRIVLTMESLANMFTSTVVPTGWSISNVQLRYKVVDFGGAVEQIVLGSSDKLYIKSQSFALASQTLAANTTGFIEIVYNMRFASVKSLFAINGNRATAGSNGAFDSVDLTSSNGDYSFSVGGVLYPPAPISTRTAKAQAMLELRSAVGSIFDKNNNMAINSVEFGLFSTTAASTYQVPAKFYIGTSTERLNSNNLLTGISTQNSPISYRINTGTAIGASNSTVSLLVNYDALIEVDCLTKQVAVKS